MKSLSADQPRKWERSEGDFAHRSTSVLVDRLALRNTRQISETFSAMAPIRMKASTTDGPAVWLEACSHEEALERADDVVDEFLEQG